MLENNSTDHVKTGMVSTCHTVGIDEEEKDGEIIKTCSKCMKALDSNHILNYYDIDHPLERYYAK